MVVYQELTLTNWAPGTTFQALAFEKHTKCENLASCLNALESALNDIGNLDLKKNTNSNVILWETWKKLMVDNKYLKMTLKNNQIRNEIAVAEDLAEVNNDTLRHANSNYEGADNQESQSTYNDELDERNFVFSMLKSGEKWYLSNGKYVDDELFIFGLQCESGHPSRSFIIDPYDSNYTTYNVFSQKELQEIINYQKKSLLTAPDSLKLFLNKYNKKILARIQSTRKNKLHTENHTTRDDTCIL